VRPPVRQDARLRGREPGAVPGGAGFVRGAPPASPCEHEREREGECIAPAHALSATRVSPQRIVRPGGRAVLLTSDANAELMEAQVCHPWLTPEITS
jgi:hypothetical protein